MGNSADFWRGRVTGLSIAYWKKSPSFAPVAALLTLLPDFVQPLIRIPLVLLATPLGLIHGAICAIAFLGALVFGIWLGVHISLSPWHREHRRRRSARSYASHDLKEAAYLASRICVMQARPGRIVDDSEVPFARPRTIDISFQPDFVSLTQRLRERIVAARAVQEDAK